MTPGRLIDAAGAARCIGPEPASEPPPVTTTRGPWPWEQPPRWTQMRRPEWDAILTPDGRGKLTAFPNQRQAQEYADNLLAWGASCGKTAVVSISYQQLEYQRPPGSIFIDEATDISEADWNRLKARAIRGRV